MQLKKETDTNETVEYSKQDSTEFSKEQILTSERFCNRRDLVEALLDDNKKYTAETVDKMIKDFMKGKVK